MRLGIILIVSLLYLPGASPVKCQWSDNSKPISRDFDIWRDLMVTRLVTRYAGNNFLRTFIHTYTHMSGNIRTNMHLRLCKYYQISDVFVPELVFSRGSNFPPLLTHWGRVKMAAIFETTFFKCIFLNENICISLKISLGYVRKVRISNIPALVQIMAWRRPGDKPFSEPMMVRLLTPIYVTRPQWVKKYRNTIYSLDSVFIFGWNHHSLIVVPPAKYEREANHLTGTDLKSMYFAQQKIRRQSFRNLNIWPGVRCVGGQMSCCISTTGT